MSTAFAPHFPENEPNTRWLTMPVRYRSTAVELSWLLETVREQVRAPLKMTSGYRPPEVNAATPGASDVSQHMDASAGDFQPVGISLYTFAVRFIEAERAGKIPTYGQLIFYPFTRSPHIHISLPTRASRNAKLIKAREGSGFVAFSLPMLRAAVAGVGTAIILALAAGFLLLRKGA